MEKASKAIGRPRLRKPGKWSSVPDATKPLIGFEAEWYPWPDFLSDEDNVDKTTLKSCQKIATLLRKYTGIRAIVPTELNKIEPNSTVENPRWIVSSDYSLDWIGSGTGNAGLEITSPPLQVEAALEAAGEIIDFVDNFGITNEYCGFHWNISTPDIKDLNPFVLAMILPEIQLAAPFERFKPIHDLVRYQILLRLALNQESDPTDVSFLHGTLLNLHKLEFGYVEFRHAGRDWLTLRQHIVPTMVVCLSALLRSINVTADLLHSQVHMVQSQAAVIRAEAESWRDVMDGPLMKNGLEFGCLETVFVEGQYAINSPTISREICSQGDYPRNFDTLFHCPRGELPYRVAMAYLFEAGLLTFS